MKSLPSLLLLAVALTVQAAGNGLHFPGAMVGLFFVGCVVSVAFCGLSKNVTLQMSAELAERRKKAQGA
ncbi:MAG: hypothetical protein ABUL61_03990 [Oleiharenicola lentus]